MKIEVETRESKEGIEIKPVGFREASWSSIFVLWLLSYLAVAHPACRLSQGSCKGSSLWLSP